MVGEFGPHKNVRENPQEDNAEGHFKNVYLPNRGPPIKKITIFLNVADETLYNL